MFDRAREGVDFVTVAIGRRVAARSQEASPIIQRCPEQENKLELKRPHRSSSYFGSAEQLASEAQGFFPQFKIPRMGDGALEGF
jgi:hypothetical protein